MSTSTNQPTSLGKRLTALVSLLLLPFALSLSGCDQALEENPPSQITPDNFFSNESEFLAAATGVYAQLRSIPTGATHNASEHTSDEMMVPTRGPNWGDGGVWRDLTRHQWNAEHPDFSGVWSTMYTGIARANGVLSSLAPSEAIPAERKAQFRAEIQFLRAYYYYWLMDFFGGVPVVLEEGNDTYEAYATQPVSPEDPPPHHSRLEVYNFILQELTGCTVENFSNDCVNNPGSNSVLANLQTGGAGGVEYGRANKGAGYAFLARLLLNSQIYAVDISGRGEAGVSDLGNGPAFYEEALTAADIVINGANGVGSYSLDNYFDNFAADNHTASSEIIFAATFQSGEQNLGLQPPFKAVLNYNQTTPAGGVWNGFTTIADFYESYATEPGPDGELGTQDDIHNDVRGKTFLVGQQYEEPDVGCAGDECFSDTTSQETPVWVGPDQEKFTSDDSPLFFTLEIPKIELGDLTEQEAADMGFPSTTKTFRLDAPGARPLKFEIDPGTTNSWFGNDFPLFRLAEMYLIRAEAQHATGQGDPIATLNTLRSERAAEGADLSLSGGNVLAKIVRERGHELYQEMVRRQDLIRYDFAHGGTDMDQPYAPTWTGPWLFKDQSEDYRALFPIPAGQLSTNPNLQQNPGY